MAYQTAITSQGTADHVYFEFDLADGADKDQVGAKLALVADTPFVMGVGIVIGIRPSLWEEIAPDPQFVPVGVHDFAEPLRGAGDYAMPATQHDVWVWIAGPDRSRVYDASESMLRTFEGLLVTATETAGWVYESNRDLTGFEDGTENPGALAAPSLVAVPDGQPGAGSSVLLYQLWEHKREWEKLHTQAQERVIGRTKTDSVELEGAEARESSHAQRTVVEVDGEEQHIYRHNTAYGGHRSRGTVFVGFSFDQWRTEEMLRRMAGADGGPRDALTYFADAVTGGWYTCPSVEAFLAMAPDDED